LSPIRLKSHPTGKAPSGFKGSLLRISLSAKEGIAKTTMIKKVTEIIIILFTLLERVNPETNTGQKRLNKVVISLQFLER